MCIKTSVAVALQMLWSASEQQTIDCGMSLQSGQSVLKTPWPQNDAAILLCSVSDDTQHAANNPRWAPIPEVYVYFHLVLDMVISAGRGAMQSCTPSLLYLKPVRL